ncbi:MAG: aminomethyl-transferring glycine dehydrogenase subunit GcvPA [Acidobacteria bacterium]|nr:aminomethyl-transferring glycine dehydrogenase subunit GcvPA [Acidobacteriota bacterium]
MSRFFPLSDDDRREMLRKVGADNIQSLFSSIPENGQFKETLNIPSYSEQELLNVFRELADANTPVRSFAGAGVYAHYIPAAVDSLASREEFLTAYTPYQPEISQGTLQSIFEYQTYMCALTGMEVSNASMYDGATAFAEAILMAKRAVKKKNTVLISDAIHPHYRKVAESYLKNLGITITAIPTVNHRIEMDVLVTALENEDVFGVAVGYPNFFGIVEPLDEIAAAVREKAPKAMLISVTTEPLAFGLLTPPGEFGVDIACGEAQSFGNYPGFGGPLLGFLTTKQKLVRNMPGRVVGQTTDVDGKTGYVLTLSAREQHIRREKATSNICSNQGWCMLRAVIYLALLGKTGLKELAELNHRLAETAKTAISKTARFKVVPGMSFNEFVVRSDADLEDFVEHAVVNGMFPGVRLSKFGLAKDEMLITVTEMNTVEDIHRLVELMEAAK